jgi:hypothetical protein
VFIFIFIIYTPTCSDQCDLLLVVYMNIYLLIECCVEDHGYKEDTVSYYSFNVTLDKVR